jgi:hypothetical protein
MAKVRDMIGDYAEPRGDSGYSVDTDVALRIAGEMRQILNLDLDEIDISLEVQIYNRSADSEELIAAWEHLNAGERRAWRQFVNYDEFVKTEKLKHAH